jgi:hypothetical protein
MLAVHDPRRDRRRDTHLFDIAAIGVSLVAIVGSVFIVNAASMRYRVGGLPVASAATMPAPAPTH